MVDEKDEPLIGASVLAVGTANGTATDIDGNFSIKANKGATLRVSYVGYLTKDVKVTDSKPLHIVLKENNGSLKRWW